MIKKLITITGIFCFLFFVANYCFAEIELIQPSACNLSAGICDCGSDDAPGCDISVNDIFIWGAIDGVVKYVLDIDQYTQSEDNIYPDKLSPACVGAGEECSFPFPNLTCCDISRSSENFLKQFCWHITAYNESGGLLDSSETRCFITEAAPEGYEDPWEYSPPVPVKNPISFSTFGEATSFLLNSLFLILVAIAVIMVIWAAVLFVTSGGDPKKISSAKKIILWAVVALFIALLARVAIGVIKGILGGEGS